MRPRNLPVILVAVATALAGPSCNEPVSEQQPGKTMTPPKNIMLIGWDGVSRQNIWKCLEEGHLPNLEKLGKEGNRVAIDILRTTDTKAGWTQILTGYEPEVTGVYSNDRYQPIPAGYTMFERFEKHFGPGNIYTAAIVSKGNNVDFDAPQKTELPPAKPGQKRRYGMWTYRERNIIKEDGIDYAVIPGKPYYNTINGMDLFVNNLDKDVVVGQKTLEQLESHKDDKFFFFIHFGWVDKMGHRHGEGSPQYHDAIHSHDLWLGKIVAKLKDLQIYDDTLIYVLTDHGFDVGVRNHLDAPHGWLVTNDPFVIRRGERNEIGPTIMDRFGLDISKIDPPITGVPLTQEWEPPIR